MYYGQSNTEYKNWVGMEMRLQFGKS